MDENPHQEGNSKFAAEVFAAADERARRSDYDGALREIERILSVDPSNVKAIEYRANLSSMRGAASSSPGPSPSKTFENEKEMLKGRKEAKLRELEEERRRLEKIRREFEELQRKEEDLRRQEEEERRRRIEEMRKEEERKRKELEEKRREEGRRQREEEERRLIDELKRKIEEENVRRLEEERRRQEEMKRQREEEEREQQEEFRRNLEEERQRKIQELQAQLEGLKIDEEKLSGQSDQTPPRFQEEDQRKKEEVLKAKEENRKKQEEQKKKEQQALKQREEESHRRQVEHRIQMDPLRRIETEERLAKEKKERVLSQIGAAEDFFNKGDYDQSLAIIADILKVDPTFPRALTLRLRAKRMKEREEQAPVADDARHMQKPVESNPPPPTLTDRPRTARRFLWIGVVILCAAVILAVVFYLLKDNAAVPTSQQKESAQASVKSSNESKGIISAPALPASSPGHPEEHLTRANILRLQKAYQSAIREYDAALTIDSSKADAYVGRGDVYLMIGKYADAIKSFVHAIDLGYRDSTILLSCACAHQLNGSFKEGSAYYELALSSAKDSTKYLVGPMADAMLHDRTLFLKFGDRTRRAFERSLSAYPGDYMCRYRYARYMISSGDSKSGNDLLQKNIDLLVEEFQKNPDDVRIMVCLALGMARLGHFTEAEGFAKDAAQYGKIHPEILYKIAQMYAVQFQSSRRMNSIFKNKALQVLREAVAARFMPDELTNADFESLCSMPEFSSAIRCPSN